MQSSNGLSIPERWLRCPRKGQLVAGKLIQLHYHLLFVNLFDKCVAVCYHQSGHVILLVVCDVCMAFNVVSHGLLLERLVLFIVVGRPFLVVFTSMDVHV